MSAVSGFRIRTTNGGGWRDTSAAANGGAPPPVRSKIFEREIMKRFIPVGIACIGLGGCASHPEPTISAPGTKMKYEWTIEIPVVRPSSMRSSALLAGAERLTAEYRKPNALAGIDHDGSIMSSSEEITDKSYRISIMSGHWHDKSWNYDPGTVAHVFLRSGGGDAPPYWGEIIFMKNGKVFGGKATGGGSNLPDYYREMKELGIYIP